MPIRKSTKKGSKIWYMDHINNDVRSATLVSFDTIDKVEVIVVTWDSAGFETKRPLLATRHVLGEWAFETEGMAKLCLKNHIEKCLRDKRLEIKELEAKLLKL